MTKMIPASDLRDGDKIKDTTGRTFTVKRAKQIKRKIPARYEKQTHLILEAKDKVNGRSSKRQETTTAYSDDEFEVIARDSFQWKVDQFKDKHGGYINAFAAATTGTMITMATYFSGITDSITSFGMLGVSLLLGGYLTIREYLKD